MYSTNDYRYYMEQKKKRSDDFLAHHGILGMKWGKRNGPPYPLSGSAHSASERKAGWKKSLGGGRNETLYGSSKPKRLSIVGRMKQRKAAESVLKEQNAAYDRGEFPKLSEDRISEYVSKAAKNGTYDQGIYEGYSRINDIVKGKNKKETLKNYENFLRDPDKFMKGKNETVYGGLFSKKEKKLSKKYPEEYDPSGNKDTTTYGSDSDVKMNKAKLATRIAIHALTMNPVGITYDLKQIGEASAAKHMESIHDKRVSSLEIDSKTGLHKKDRDWTAEQDMKAVNPGFKDFDKNTKNNCMLCTTTYEMRRRGYDVTANKTDTGFVSDKVTDWFPKAKVEAVYNPQVGSKEWWDSKRKASGLGGNKELAHKTVETLSKQPDGARGNIMVGWGASMGGHSMVYEVNNGKVIIRDCQSNKVYTNPEKILKQCATVQYARLDNLDFDSKKIKEAVR